MAIIIYKVLCKLNIKIAAFISKFRCYIIFYINGVNIKSFRSNGIPYIHVSLNASCNIGKNLTINNSSKFSDSGMNGKCRIEVRDTATLNIANNVGMSDVTITCHNHIYIGNNVLLGVGVHIRDTDNHSLNPEDRILGNDWINKKTAPIIIQDNVFIGLNSIILKGVTIGKNSIIGAGSVVTKNIPANEIWAGNPAKFIKNI